MWEGESTVFEVEICPSRGAAQSSLADAGEGKDLPPTDSLYINFPLDHRLPPPKNHRQRSKSQNLPLRWKPIQPKTMTPSPSIAPARRRRAPWLANPAVHRSASALAARPWLPMFPLRHRHACFSLRCQSCAVLPPFSLPLCYPFVGRPARKPQVLRMTEADVL